MNHTGVDAMPITGRASIAFEYPIDVAKKRRR